MPVITPQLCAQLEAHGLKIYGSVNIRTLPPIKIYHPGKTKEQLLKNGGETNAFAYAIKFKAPAVIYSNCMLSNCTIGAYSYINANSSLHLCTIGNYCSLGSNMCLGLPQHVTTSATTSLAFCPEGDPFLARWTHGHFIPSQLSTYYPVNIGHDVWIGNNVTVPVARPIDIGTGAVIAANSVVTHDVPPYAIVAGNPARVIKMRFSDEICADLLASHWFDYDLPGFEQCEQMEIHDPKRFLENFAHYHDYIPKLTEQYVQLTGI